MQPANLEDFTAQAMDEGFDEIITREWAPDLQLDCHTHPFDLRVHVARGSLVLTVGDTSRPYTAGDGFRLARNTPHAEHYGPQGATFWVARAN